MKISNRQKGQTLIETALILFVLLIILLGIAEFARAWYTKNSIKNAARQGARVAVVTPTTDLTASLSCDNQACTFNCINTNTCPDTSNVAKNAICCQPGIPKKPEDATTVSIKCFDKDDNLIDCNDISEDGTVEVNITSTYALIVGNWPWPWPKQINMSGNASMRYE